MARKFYVTENCTQNLRKEKNVFLRSSSDLHAFYEQEAKFPDVVIIMK